MQLNSSNDDSRDDSSRASSDDLADHRGVATAVKREDGALSPPLAAVVTAADTIGSSSSTNRPYRNGQGSPQRKRPSSAIAAIILGAAAAAPLPPVPNETPSSSLVRVKQEPMVKTEPQSPVLEPIHARGHPRPQPLLVGDSGGDTAATEKHDDCVDEKSVSANDSATTTYLEARLDTADADTRAIAETMIRNVNASQGAKSATGGEKDKDASKDKKTDKTQTEAKSQAKPKVNPRNSNAGKESFKMELNYKHQNLAQADQLRSDQLRSTQFPFRLHNMLDDAERSGHSHIVSWCKGGESFRIHKPTELISVLQKYFRQSKFKSFLRQLQGYDFKRVTRGKNQGVVSHPLFLRGRRSLSTYMKRKRVGPKVNGVNVNMNDGIDAETKQALVAAGEPLPKSLKVSIQEGPPAKKPKTTTTTNTTNSCSGGYGVPAKRPGALHIAPQLVTTTTGAASRLPPLAATTSKTVPIAAAIHPAAQDVLCVDVPNVQHFQGNRKLASIVQKILGHYTTAPESVQTMIVNEISGRIQKGGSRFLRLTYDGLNWMECNPSEIFQKVVSCFEDEIRATKKNNNHVDLTCERSNSPETTGAGESATTSQKTALATGTCAAHKPTTTSESARRQDPPREQDVVLRGGPVNEKEGNAYLITMIQANVGHQVDSFEMKRIKCRAILERMKRRGSRFFLKLNEADADDGEMYLLSDTEAQDVIYTAFCAEEKKIQSVLNEAKAASASSLLHHQALAGIEGLSQHSSLATSRLEQSQQQSEARLMSIMRANGMELKSMTQSSLKRPLEAHDSLGTAKMIEKQLRAETDEHVQLLLERARQHRHQHQQQQQQQQQKSDSFGVSGLTSGLAGGLPLHGRSHLLESALGSSSLYGGGGSSSDMEQLLNERRVDEILLKSAMARNAFASGTTAGLGGDLAPNHNRFVEFLKKKYSGPERGW